MPPSLDPRYLPFMNTASRDVDSNAPRLELAMGHYGCSDSSELCLTLPYRIEFVTTRPKTDDRRHLSYRWSVWESMARGQFVLLHEKAFGALEPIEVGVLGGLVDSMYRDEVEAISETGSEVEEYAPGGQTSRICHLTANYQTQLVPGEKYHLLWPGAQIVLWDWGFKKEFRGTNLGPRTRNDGAGRPALMLSPAAGVTFTALHANEPFPDRHKFIECDGPHASYDTANDVEQNWRDQQERLRKGIRWEPEKVRGTAVTIEGAPVLRHEIVRAGPFYTVSKVTYEASSGDRAITFREWPFHRQFCQLYCLREEEWKEVPEDSDLIACFPFPEDDEDDIDFRVKVGEDNNDFMSLQPGESWTEETHYHPSKNIKRGDKFKYVFKGTTLDWWDWGSKQDHINTVVTLPALPGFPFRGDMQDPADNNGRPKVVVPESNQVEFVWGE